MKKFLTCLFSVLTATMFALITACAGETGEVSTSAPVDTTKSAQSVGSAQSASASASVWDSTWSSERDPYEWTAATEYNLGTNDGTQKTTVYLVGDSTVCNYEMAKESGRYYPRNGYGMWFDDYLNENVTVNNLALSGRSSKSFIKEKNYTTLKDNIKAGDYLVIGFGHNDQKTSLSYYTNPASEVIHDDSFKYYLYNYYVKLALDVGATPILCTPIIRVDYPFDTHPKDFHLTGTQTTSGNPLEGGDYPKAIRELGEQFGVTVVDLTKITKDFFTALDYEDVKTYYAASSSVETSLDTTHLNAFGAATVAYKFMQAIAETENSLKNYINQAAMETVPDLSLRVPISELI